MAKLYVNVKLNFKSLDEKIWSAKNGATRRTLVVISKLGDIGNKDCLICRVGWLNKGNHSFIFLNPSNKDDQILGLFLDHSYGYSLIKGKELFSASSVGGYGNSESKFGIYTLGTILKCETYKNRNGYDYYELTHSGWKDLGRDYIFEDDLKNIEYVE